MGQAAMYEEANRSIFGPACFNAAAPDDGNMMVLAKAGTPAQQEHWLLPIVRGEVRSAFVMTEPHPGGGSDPSMIRTRAERQADGSYVVHGTNGSSPGRRKPSTSSWSRGRRTIRATA